MGNLCLAFLGPPEVRHADRIVRFSTRKELAYHAQAARLAGPTFYWNLVAGDEAMRVAAVQDAISFYEQAQYLMTECLHGFDLEATFPELKIEHLYTHLGQPYELSAEREKARQVYTLMLAYARDASFPMLESTALNCLAALAAS